MPAIFPGDDIDVTLEFVLTSIELSKLQLGRRIVDHSDLYLTNAELPNDISSSAPFFRSVPFKPPHILVQKSNNKLEENVAQVAFMPGIDSARRKKLVPLRRFTVYFILRFR